MGYCTDGRGRLVCDSCGNVGHVRKRKCIYKVLGDSLRSLQRIEMHYCYPPALCPGCYRSRGGARGVHGDQCRDGAARFQAEHDATQKRLDAGEWCVVSASGDWRKDVPAGMVEVTFWTAGGPASGERRICVPADDYDPRGKPWLSDYQ